MTWKKAITKVINAFGIGIIRTSSILEMNTRREELENYVRKLELFIRLQPHSRFEKGLISSKLSKSQIGADIFALDTLNFKEDGYFIECGAGDGVHLSNTLLLEKRFGWTGILVEPNKRFHDNITRMRSARLEKRLLGSRTGELIAFKEFHVGELSGVTNVLGTSNETVRDEYTIESIGLGDLLKKHKAPRVIDYFSLDVEGYEYEILKDFDFSEYTFRTLSIEHNFSSDRKRIFDLLAENSYCRVHENLSEFDDYYVHRSTYERNS